jgi:hypothetical protein
MGICIERIRLIQPIEAVVTGAAKHLAPQPRRGARPAFQHDTPAARLGRLTLMSPFQHLLAPLLLLAAGPAWAQAEQLEQLEPGAGERQVEYFGGFGGEGEQSVQGLVGLSDRVALGAEAQFRGPRDGIAFEGVGLVALYRFADPDERPVGFGIEAAASFDRGARLAEVEGRAIVEQRSRRWWTQADAIVRVAREQGRQGTGLAYSAAVSRAAGGGWWIGVEASGQLARIGGDSDLAPEGQHYAGPSVTLERDLGRRQVELGIAWMQRIAGRGPGSAPRMFVQFTF